MSKLRKNENNILLDIFTQNYMKIFWNTIDKIYSKKIAIGFIYGFQTTSESHPSRYEFKQGDCLT